MGILQLPTQQPNMVGVFPNQKFMVTTDNLATITTAGYLNQVNLESNPISTTDILQVLYSFNQQTNVGTYGVFTVTITGANSTITLVPDVNEGDVLLPVVSGDFAVFNGTTGQIKDAGYLPSNAAKTNVVMAGSAVQTGYIAHFVDTSGTIDDTAGAVINAGNIQAGLSGTSGTLISYPATAAKGSLRVTGVANTGDTITTISNAAMGQASVVSIPDPAASTANFVVAPSALVNDNLVKASGTAGLVVDGGVAIGQVMQLNAVNTMTGASSIVLAKVNGTEASNAVTASGVAGFITTSSLTTAAGSNYAITWTNTFISATSVIGLTIQGGTNTTQNINFKVVAGSGSATLTIYNLDASSALNGTIVIGYSVL